MASFEALLSRDFPNSMARIDNPPGGPVVNFHPELPILSLAAKSRRQANEACRFLVTIASRIDVLYIALHSLEVAAQLVRFEPACLRNVVAVVPERADDTIVLPYAKEICELDHWPACNQLTRQSR